jgi:hypothetical protein
MNEKEFEVFCQNGFKMYDARYTNKGLIVWGFFRVRLHMAVLVVRK